MMSRVRDGIGVRLAADAPFRAPTVAGLAAVIETLGSRESGAGTQAIVPVSRGGRLPLSFAQQRLWFLDQLVPDRRVYVVPVVWRLPAGLDERALAGAFDDVARRQEAWRTRFVAHDGVPWQEVGPPLSVGLETVDLSSVPGPEREESVRRLIAGQVALPFDLAVGPLVRARLLRLGERERILLVTTHHIIFDGWSVGVLLSELSAAYRRRGGGGPPGLGGLAVQLDDFAVRERQVRARGTPGG